MKLTVVIVNYNVKYYIEQCLNSLEKALKGIESEIFVVDNHSEDDSIGYLRKRFEYVNIIESNRNLGFARANNIAIRRSSGEYILLLNPDTFVCENTIRGALEFSDKHLNAGGVGVKMYNADGTVAMESRRGLPTPMTSFYKMCGLCAKFPKSKRFGRYYMSYLDWDKPAKIDVVSGAFFLVRRSALDKVGLLDTDFFMYGEDIDLSYRLLKGGFDNWYLPFQILHYKGESTHKTSFRYVHVFYQAMLIFFRKHYGHLKLGVVLPIKVAIYMKAFIAFVVMMTKWMRKSLGFVEKFGNEPKFIFIGNERMLKSCIEISHRMGLTTESFCVKNENEIRKIRFSVCADGKAVTYIVFDTTVYSYENIINFMSKNKDTNVKLGTFNVNTGILITPDEIIR